MPRTPRRRPTKSPNGTGEPPAGPVRPRSARPAPARTCDGVPANTRRGRMTSTTARADRTDLPAPAPAGGPPLHWRAAGVSLVLDCSGPLLPRVLHWGADLFDRSGEELVELAVAATPQTVS